MFENVSESLHNWNNLVMMKFLKCIVERQKQLQIIYTQIALGFTHSKNTGQHSKDAKSRVR